jgi:hypothetical protein
MSNISTPADTQAPVLRRYVVKVSEVFEDTFIVVASSLREARRLAEENFDPDMAGQELVSDVTSELPLNPGDERKGPRFLGSEYEVEEGMVDQEEEPSYALQVTTGNHATDFDASLYLDFCKRLAPLNHLVEVKDKLLAPGEFVVYVRPDEFKYDAPDFDYHDEASVKEFEAYLQGLFPDLGITCFSVQTA